MSDLNVKLVELELLGVPVLSATVLPGVEVAEETIRYLRLAKSVGVSPSWIRVSKRQRLWKLGKILLARVERPTVGYWAWYLSWLRGETRTLRQAKAAVAAAVRQEQERL